MPPNSQNPPNPPTAPKADDKAPAPHPLSAGAASGEQRGPAILKVSEIPTGTARAGSPDVRPAGTRYRILHSGVGRHGKGEVVSAGDLGGDPERLVRLGAIAEEG